jgi:hypothetical protein
MLGRALLQEALVGEQPVGDALGVVQAVDRQDDPGLSQRLAELLPLADDLRLGCLAGEEVEIDPIGKVSALTTRSRRKTCPISCSWPECGGRT